ncbi:MAG: class I SAM-dependent methyltransferase [Marinilabiliales bacterium]|nr:class I SAM-dependent methyltransferase [Marinilabiliales bacterium]
MQYDPIKRRLGYLFNQTTILRRLFYKLLDLLLLRSWHIRRALKEYRKEAPKGRFNLLDAGSGFGQYCFTLSNLFPEAAILGVDVKQEQVDDCNTFFRKIGRGQRVTFMEADLTQFRVPEHYHLILSVDVMEHIEPDELVFRNFSESLKPGGCLLISTPSDLGGSDADHHDGEGVHGFIDEHVRDGYNREEITEKLLNNGFSRVEVTYTYGRFGSLAWRLTMKYPIQMLGVSGLFYLLLPFYYLIAFPIGALLNRMDLLVVNKRGTGLLVKAYK